MRTAQEVIRDVRVTQAPNGMCYAVTGEVTLPEADLERMVHAVPRSIAAALDRKAFYFVPLAVGEGDKTLIAEHYDSPLTDRALCHRNIDTGGAHGRFISIPRRDEKVSIAF